MKAAGAVAGNGILLAQNPPSVPARARPASPFTNNRSRNPNVVFILADDLGYGDLGSYGSRIQTPNVDRLAAEGVRFTQFASTSPVCSPSRAALLTGRYQTRVGVPDVLFPNDTIGLPASETTLAQLLQAEGYRTMCIGKWHLGSRPQFMPTQHGFDAFFGLPYSNDMLPRPLLSNATILEEPANLATLTERYTEQAVSFIQRSRETPFFLYFAHTSPHLPLAPSDRFHDKSGFGPYGDVVEELDWSVGEVLRAIRDNGLDPFTIVMFTSDNGPWYQGSTGNLRGRKGETLEGGVREPFLARFPGRIPPGLVSTGVASTLDILPTVSRLCGAPLPGKPLDGVDIWPLLTGAQQSVARDLLLYFDGWNLQCARSGRWKLHVSRYDRPPWLSGDRTNLPLPNPELYDLESDPEESYNAAADNPQVVAAIRARMEALLGNFPEQVQTAWRNTMAIAVNDTPAGAYPVRKQDPG